LAFDVSFQEIAPTLVAGDAVVSREPAYRRAVVVPVRDTAVTSVYLPAAALHRSSRQPPVRVRRVSFGVVQAVASNCSIYYMNASVIIDFILVAFREWPGTYSLECNLQVAAVNRVKYAVLRVVLALPT